MPWPSYLIDTGRLPIEQGMIRERVEEAVRMVIADLVERWLSHRV
jgi:hypothetical protein